MKSFMIMLLMFVAVLVVYDRNKQQEIIELKKIIEAQRLRYYVENQTESQPIVLQADQPQVVINQPADQPADQPTSQPASYNSGSAIWQHSSARNTEQWLNSSRHSNCKRGLRNR